MLYTDVRTTTGYDGTKRSELVFGYSRKPTPFDSFHKAIFGAVVALALFALTAVVLSATDVPDTKPTINVTGGW